MNRLLASAKHTLGLVSCLVACWALSAVPAGADTLYGITNNAHLVRFDSQNPGSILADLPSQFARDLSVDPITGKLIIYQVFLGFGGGVFLREIDPLTGSPTLLSEVNLFSFQAPNSLAFDPVTGQARLIGPAVVYQVNPATGEAIEESLLSYAPGDVFEGATPNIWDASYLWDRSGPTPPILYGVDISNNTLVRFEGGNLLRTIGSLGLTFTVLPGFDISEDGTAYLNRVASSGLSELYRVNLGTGSAEFVGNIGMTTPLSAVITVAAARSGPAVVPEPGIGALFSLAGGFGLFGFVRRRGRR